MCLPIAYLGKVLKPLKTIKIAAVTRRDCCICICIYLTAASASASALICLTLINFINSATIESNNFTRTPFLLNPII